MKKLVIIVSLGVFLTGCFGLFDKDEPVAPVVLESTEVELSKPQFEAEIDEEDAFDKALDAVPADQVPRFVEVIDEIDADSVQAADEGEKEEFETEEDKAARAASEAKAVAREQAQTGTTDRGLDIRQYSDDLFVQVKGVRPALIYFTAADCEECSAWEDAIRAEAAAFADRNTLIMLADIEAQAALAADMKVKNAGQAMLVTGVGELMGPLPSTSVTKDQLLFIFN